MDRVLDFITNHWELISTLASAIIYEIVARRTPTRKNISLLDNALKLISHILKNRRKPDPEDVTADEVTNQVTVKRDKHIVMTAALLLALL